MPKNVYSSSACIMPKDRTVVLRIQNVINNTITLLKLLVEHL